MSIHTCSLFSSSWNGIHSSKPDANHPQLGQALFTTPDLSRSPWCVSKLWQPVWSTGPKPHILHCTGFAILEAIWRSSCDVIPLGAFDRRIAPSFNRRKASARICTTEWQNEKGEQQRSHASSTSTPIVHKSRQVSDVKVQLSLPCNTLPAPTSSTAKTLETFGKFKREFVVTLSHDQSSSFIDMCSYGSIA